MKYMDGTDSKFVINTLLEILILTTIKISICF